MYFTTTTTTLATALLATAGTSLAAPAAALAPPTPNNAELAARADVDFNFALFGPASPLPSCLHGRFADCTGERAFTAAFQSVNLDRRLIDHVAVTFVDAGDSIDTATCFFAVQGAAKQPVVTVAVGRDRADVRFDIRPASAITSMRCARK